MAAFGCNEFGQAVYSACECCTAKWFSRHELEACPRCRSNRVLHTRAKPPWQRRDDPESGIGDMNVDSEEIVPAPLSDPKQPGPTQAGTG